MDPNMDNNGGFIAWKDFKKKYWDNLMQRGWKCSNSQLGEYTFFNVDRTVVLESRKAVAEYATALFEREEAEQNQARQEGTAT